MVIHAALLETAKQSFWCSHPSLEDSFPQFLHNLQSQGASRTQLKTKYKLWNIKVQIRQDENQRLKVITSWQLIIPSGLHKLIWTSQKSPFFFLLPGAGEPMQRPPCCVCLLTSAEEMNQINSWMTLRPSIVRFQSFLWIFYTKNIYIYTFYAWKSWSPTYLSEPAQVAVHLSSASSLL